MKPNQTIFQMTKNWQCPYCQSRENKTDLFMIDGFTEEQLSTFQKYEQIALICKKCGHIQLLNKYFMH